MPDYTELIDAIREKSLREEAVVASRIRGCPKLIRPVARETDLVAAEQSLGFRIPELLRRCYLDVGNGGFGPGARILGVGPDGKQSDFEKDCVGTSQAFADAHRLLRATDETPVELGQWKDSYLVFIDYGCASHGIVDCEDGSVLTDFERTISRDYSCLDWYFEDWVNDRPFCWAAPP